MKFKTWFAHLAQFATSSDTSHRQRSKFRPGLEALEDRTVPATITVTGTGEGGGTYEVIPTGPNSYNIGDLRDALNYAASLPGADTILFAPSIAGQTINLTKDDLVYPTDMGHTALVITDTITIIGDAKHGMTIDAGNARRLFGVGPTGNLTLQNLTLTGGLAQGGMGGVNVWSGAAGGGGAGLGGSIYVYKGWLHVTNCTFTGNTAQGGGGGTINTGGQTGGSGGGSAAFDGGSPNGGSAGGGGAGMYGPGQDANNNTGGLGGQNQNGKTTPANNTGGLGGGGGGGSYTTFGDSIDTNHSGGPATGVNRFGFGGAGGGGAAGQLVGGGISFGEAHGGAGGFGGGGGGAGYSDGSAKGGEGGFGGGGGGGTGYSDAGNSVFGGGSGGVVNPQQEANNTQGGGGGGGAGLGGAIFANTANVTIQTSTFTNNNANGGGGGQGGIWSGPGDNGSGWGGAIFMLNGALQQIGNSTISGNNASSGGNQIYFLSQGKGNVAKANIVNTVIGQAGSSDAADVVFTSIQGGTTPQITGTKNFVSTPGLFPRSALAGTGDPKLLPLADNGGPTMTMLPQADSPLIDAGYNALRGRLLKDQRGVNRVINAFMDIGSVEVDVVKPPFLRDTALRYGVLQMEILLTFSGQVKVSPGAFQLFKASDGTAQPVSIRLENVNGYSIVHIAASPLLYMRRVPLLLTLDGTLITDKNGVALPALSQQMLLSV
ncbi:MAG: choice-of-anchor Q domain-containing protein [Gemmatales bacterium]